MGRINIARMVIFSELFTAINLWVISSLIEMILINKRVCGIGQEVPQIFTVFQVTHCHELINFGYKKF